MAPPWSALEPLSLFPLFFWAGAALWNELAKSVYVLEVFFIIIYLFFKEEVHLTNLLL